MGQRSASINVAGPRIASKFEIWPLRSSDLLNASKSKNYYEVARSFSKNLEISQLFFFSKGHQLSVPVAD